MAIFLQVETRVWESFGSGKVNHAQHDKKNSAAPASLAIFILGQASISMQGGMVIS
jgi:hypothetical protein